jgi:UDP-glucose 4-epimerase
MTLANRKICVTGGAGFIGSKLVAALRSQGAQIVVIDDLSVGRREALPPGVRFVRADVLDSEAVLDAMRGCDLLYHLAARVAIRSSFEFVVKDTMTNVSGTASVLRAAQVAGTVRRVVFTSSMAVYADSASGSLVNETSPTAPLSPYGISKLAAEALTHQLCSNAGMSSVVLRLFNTYGHGQRLSPYVGAVTIFCNKLSEGKAPEIFGDGEQSRDFVHVEDVVQALLRAGEADVSGETYNVGTGVATSVNQVVEYLKRALEIQIEPKHVPAAAGELRCSVADISKARKQLGYSPLYNFSEAVVEVAREIVGAGAERAAVAR